MAILNPISKSPTPLYGGPTNRLADQIFSVSVDEPIGGPVVVRVTGTLNSQSRSRFSECMGDAIVHGKSLVVDLLDIEAVDAVTCGVLVAAATRVIAGGGRITLACSTHVRRTLAECVQGDRLSCYPTSARAIVASMTPDGTDIIAAAAASDDALHGTYL
jgi:anti-anti-sigma regulatory factor